MLNFQTVMQWVTKLPDVSDSILKEREDVISLACEAAEFDRLANEKRCETYRAALALESRIRCSHWTDADINAAKAKIII